MCAFLHACTFSNNKHGHNIISTFFLFCQQEVNLTMCILNIYKVFYHMWWYTMLVARSRSGGTRVGGLSWHWRPQAADAFNKSSHHACVTVHHIVHKALLPFLALLELLHERVLHLLHSIKKMVHVSSMARSSPPCRWQWNSCRQNESNNKLLVWNRVHECLQQRNGE